jgi:hypothetical protein
MIDGPEIDTGISMSADEHHPRSILPLRLRAVFLKFNLAGTDQEWGIWAMRHTTPWRTLTWNTQGNLVMLGSLDSTAAVFEFTPDGDLVSAWRIPTPEREKLHDIACDPSGRVHISGGFYRRQMYMFDSRGRLLTRWNTVTEGKEPLESPMGIAVDATGFLYVVDWSRSRVVKYEPSP